MNRYYYDGPVMQFNTCIANNWKGETVAPSENKARSNWIYQFKTKNNRVACSNISLPGKIVKMD